MVTIANGSDDNFNDDCARDFGDGDDRIDRMFYILNVKQVLFFLNNNVN